MSLVLMMLPKRPVIFPNEAPNLGGFISSTTVVRGDWWRLGQIKPGDVVKLRRISSKDAKVLRLRIVKFLDDIEGFVTNGGTAAGSPLQPLDMRAPTSEYSQAVLKEIPATSDTPRVTYRQVN